MVDGFNGCETVCDLVCHDDSNVVFAGEPAEQCANLSELVVALCQRFWSFVRCALAKFRAEVGCYAIDDDQANVVALDGNWNLIAQDMLLRFEIMNVSTLYAAECRL